MLTIRLQRVGKRNQPEYRIVLAEKPSAVTKKFIEVLGNYNPRTKDFNISNQDRLKYWIEQHVELSPTVHNLFITKNLIDGAKRRAFAIPKKTEEPTPSASAVAPTLTGEIPAAEAELAAPSSPTASAASEAAALTETLAPAETASAPAPQQ